MVAIKEARIWRITASYVITIPKDYMDNGLLNTEDIYEVEIKKVKQ